MSGRRPVAAPVRSDQARAMKKTRRMNDGPSDLPTMREDVSVREPQSLVFQM